VLLLFFEIDKFDMFSILFAIIDLFDGVSFLVDFYFEFESDFCLLVEVYFGLFLCVYLIFDKTF
jgi:hypothetical protein